MTTEDSHPKELDNFERGTFSFIPREEGPEPPLEITQLVSLKDMSSVMRRMAIRCMNPMQILLLSLISPEAAEHVKEAGIEAQSFDISLTRDCWDQIEIELKFMGYDGKIVEERIEWVFYLKEYFNDLVGLTNYKKNYSIETDKRHIIKGSLLNACYSKYGRQLISPHDKPRLAGVFQVAYSLLLSNFLNTSNPRLTIYQPSEMFPLISWMFVPGYKKTLSELALHTTSADENWKIEDLERVLKCTDFKTLTLGINRPERSIEFSAEEIVFMVKNTRLNHEWKRLDAKRIKLNPGEKKKYDPYEVNEEEQERIENATEAFNTMIKLWCSGDGLQRLESLELKAVGPVDTTLVEKNLVKRPWNQKRRPGYIIRECDEWSGFLKKNTVKQPDDYDLPGMNMILTVDSFDVHRTDGRIGTVVYYDFNKKVEFIVWNGLEHRKAAEDVVKVRETLESHRKRIEKLSDELSMEEQHLEWGVKESQRKINMIKEVLTRHQQIAEKLEGYPEKIKSLRKK